MFEYFEFKRQNKSYCGQLEETVTQFRASKKRPQNSFGDINQKTDAWYKNSKQQFIRLPTKCLNVLDYATPQAREVFYQFLKLHRLMKLTQNGLLTISYEKLCQLSGLGRTSVSRALTELACLGLIRIYRAKPKSGHTNAYLLTCFADCLGGVCARDYEQTGLCEMRWAKGLSNDAKHNLFLHRRDIVQKMLEDER